MSREEFDFREFDHFQYGNIFCGSKGPIRWRVEPRIPKEKELADQSVLHLWCWWDGLCFEKCTPSAEADFPLTPEGLEAAKDWLSQEFRKGPGEEVPW